MDFNVEAANWDDERRKTRAKLVANEIIKSIPIKQNIKAMEFGCGTGLVSFNLMNKFEHITLIDSSKGMIDSLNLKIQKSEVKNMSAYQTDINKDFIINGEFDVIYTSMALHHIIDTRTTLKNLYRLLRDRGNLCIVELEEEGGSFHQSEKDFDGHNGFNQNKLKEMLEEVGFKNIATNTFYSDDRIVDGLKVKYSLFLMVGEK